MENWVDMKRGLLRVQDLASRGRRKAGVRVTRTLSWFGDEVSLDYSKIIWWAGKWNQALNLRSDRMLNSGYAIPGKRSGTGTFVETLRILVWTFDFHLTLTPWFSEFTFTVYCGMNPLTQQGQEDIFCFSGHSWIESLHGSTYIEPFNICGGILQAPNYL